MGALFLIIFGIGLHLIFREFAEQGMLDDEFIDIPKNFLTMMGLYITNFLVVIMSVLISVAAISSEIESRLIDTLVTKPMHRWQIVLGKWLGFATMSALYALFLAGGVLIIAWLRVGVVMDRPIAGISLICLNAILVMSITIAGGTRLSTLANGVMAFMLYGVAFIGGWIEVIGSTLRNETAVNLGIVASLILPIEALWRKAALYFQPRMLGNFDFGGPFTVTSEPSDAMIVYALLYVVALLWFAVWSFGRRDL